MTSHPASCEEASCSHQLIALHFTHLKEYELAQTRWEHIGTNLALLICDIQLELLKLVRVLLLCSL